MIFSSTVFFLFFVAVLLALASLKSQTAKKWLLLVASYYFYGYWDYRFLSLIIFSTMVDYILGLKIADSRDDRMRRRYLVLSIVSNLGLLAFFKYCNFFIDSANALLGFTGFHLATLSIILPVGISFYTFQTMSYTIDIYRGHLKPRRDVLDFALFVAFFPQLVAGPIVRASEFLPQLDQPIAIKRSNLVVGLQIFIIGLVKKMLVADNLAYYVDTVYASPQVFDAPTLWLATIAYSIQIFADFSGYSDMAIGLARCLGFSLPTNFHMPYLALNVTDFWRRWHISLSTWLRDYVYIPLGGNRKGPRRTYINLILTMLLGGLWHGASWNFVIWGALHGVGLAAHKFLTYHWPRISEPTLAIKVGSWFATYFFVLLVWVFFRGQSFADAVVVLQRMFSPFYKGVSYFYTPFVAALLPLTIMAHLLGKVYYQERYPVFNRINVASIGAAAFTLLSLFFFSPIAAKPFVYFQF